MTADGDTRTSSSHAIIVKWTAFIVAFLLVTLLVLHSSFGAFSATTANAGDAISTGNVNLTDNDASVAMFNAVTGQYPGVNIDRCITVDYTGTLDPVPVELYMSAAPGGTLAPYLNLTIDMGNASGDTFPACTSFTSTANIYTGTLSGFAGANNSWATGLATWDPAAASSRTFRVRISVQDTNSAMAQTASAFAFTWEARSA